MLSGQDVKYASQMIQADLDRFQRQKVADVRSMSIALATAHRDWCKQVCPSYLPSVRSGARPDDPASLHRTLRPGSKPRPPSTRSVRLSLPRALNSVDLKLS